jgi:hypothetical protein
LVRLALLLPSLIPEGSLDNAKVDLTELSCGCHGRCTVSAARLEFNVQLIPLHGYQAEWSAVKDRRGRLEDKIPEGSRGMAPMKVNQEDRCHFLGHQVVLH